MVMNLFDDGVADEIALQKRRREGELSSSENNNVVASTDTQERFAGGVDMSIDVPDELERMRKTITGLIHEPDWWNLDRVIEVADEFINTTRHTKSVRYLVAILIQGIAPPPFGARRAPHDTGQCLGHCRAGWPPRERRCRRRRADRA